MKSKFAIAFAALATISLLAVSAVADGSGRGCMGNQGQRGGSSGPYNAWTLLIDEDTADNFENMTPAEIDALKQEKMQELNNMTLAEIEALKQQKMEERESMTLAELKAEMSSGKAGRFQGGMGPSQRGDNFGSMGGDFRAGMNRQFEVPVFLLMDGISEEDLNNMTLSEIRDLGEQKMQELENMTLSEIEELWQQKVEERNNTTLVDMRAQGANCSGMAGPMMGFADDMGVRLQDRDFGRSAMGPRR
jgi:hypothetical protein